MRVLPSLQAGLIRPMLTSPDRARTTPQHIANCLVRIRGWGRPTSAAGGCSERPARTQARTIWRSLADCVGRSTGRGCVGTGYPESARAWSIAAATLVCVGIYRRSLGLCLSFAVAEDGEVRRSRTASHREETRDAGGNAG